MPRLFVLGSVNEDVTVFARRRPSPGETLLAESAHRAIGGKGVNQALAAAREGADVVFLGAVGDDPAGVAARSLLHRAGIDTSELVDIPDVTTGLALITVTDDGENTILVASGANHAVAPGIMSTRLRTLAHTPDSVILTQGELAPDTLIRLAETITATGATWVLNLAPFVPLPIDTLRRAAILVVNETELDDLAAFMGLPAGPPASCAPTLAVALAVSIVVTLGAHGALVVEAGTATHVPAEPARKVVDTTGAGDAFVGALAAAVAAGETLTAAAARGTHLGAIAVARKGAALVPPHSSAITTT